MTTPNLDMPILPQTSATDQVFKALYDAVISTKLPPGTKLSEAEIAKQLGVSRQPVRDAFFRLSNLGFLSIRPQRATLISPISAHAVRDAVFTRIALEVECLRSAMTNQNAALAKALADNLDQQKGALGSNPARFHALDESFHETICNLAGHAHVWSLIREQKAHLDRIRYLTLSEERKHLVLNEHETLLAAIKAKDTVTAEASLRDHISGVLDILADIQNRYPTYFEAP